MIAATPKAMPRTPLRLPVVLPLALAWLVSCASMRESTIVEPPPPAPLTAGAVDPPPPLRATAPPVGTDALIDSDLVPVGASPVLGRPDALVTIIEFSDFQCPFCSRVQPALRRVRELYGDSVRIVFKNAPLPFHPNAMPAAQAAMEVYYQLGNEGFWRYHDLLYANQRALARADLEHYAEQLQIDMVRFRSALDQQSHHDEIERDRALAARSNLDGTPAFLINGTPLVGAQPFAQFVAVIDPVLERARTITPREAVYRDMVASPVAAPERPRAAAPPRLDPATRYRVSVDDAPILGPADALVTMVEFTDFQCPFCSRVQPTLAALRQRYGNDLRIVFRNLPLEFHPRALPAAEAAREAFAQRGNEAFWRYHDLLFAHQGDAGGLERAALDGYARQVGINPRRFAAALAQSTHRAVIERDKQQAETLGVQGTPNFFINGRRYDGARPEAEFIAAIDRELVDARAELARGTRRDHVYEALTAQGATAPAYIAGTQPRPTQPSVYALARNPNAPTRGAAQGRVVIQVMSDFQCPFCRLVLPTVEQVLRQYPNDVLIEWHDYPLPFHNNAMDAAEAGREAMAQGGSAAFWRYHDLMFANQRSLDRADLDRYAVQAGLDLARFRSALDQHTHTAAVRADVTAANATGASIGTPAFFINGQLLEGARPFADFARVIDAEIARPRRP